MTFDAASENRLQVELPHPACLAVQIWVEQEQFGRHQDNKKSIRLIYFPVAVQVGVPAMVTPYRMQNPTTPARHTAGRMLQNALACFLVLTETVAIAQERPHDHAPSPGQAPAPFIASTVKPFSALMQDAMAIMDDGMRRAPMNGSPDHDFLTMMVPHHQGAVDMAKALLVYSRDPELRNLAQGIITEQQNEIRLMQAWLERYRTRPSNAATSPR
jgi:hypothetical protein